MPPSMHTVLVEAVDRADASGDPVTAQAIADSLAVPESELSGSLASLCQFELLEATDRGYRPTVTGRELLAADIRLDDAVVLEFVEE